MDIHGGARFEAKRFAGVLGLVAAMSLAGCSDPKKAYDQGFNDAFNKLTHDACVSDAAGNGAAADLGERYCGCVVKQLGSLTSAQKLGLDESHPANSPELQNAFAACRAQVQQSSSS